MIKSVRGRIARRSLVIGASASFYALRTISFRPEAKRGEFAARSKLRKNIKNRRR